MSPQRYTYGVSCLNKLMTDETLRGYSTTESAVAAWNPSHSPPCTCSRKIWEHTTLKPHKHFNASANWVCNLNWHLRWHLIRRVKLTACLTWTWSAATRAQRRPPSLQSPAPRGAPSRSRLRLSLPVGKAPVPAPGPLVRRRRGRWYCGRWLHLGWAAGPLVSNGLLLGHQISL